MNDYERWTKNYERSGREHIERVELQGYLEEANALGAQLIAFGKKVRKEGARL